MYMREMVIMVVYPGPNLSKRDLQHRVFPNLLPKLPITTPNQVLECGYYLYPYDSGLEFLYTVTACYSPYIDGLAVGQSLEIGFVLEMMKRAFEYSSPREKQQGAIHPL
jgi:putative transposase